MPKKLSYEEAKAKLKWGDSYQRAGILLDLSQSMGEEDWLRLLGSEWSGCDNTYSLKNLLKLLLERKTYPQMMDEEELAAFELLPDTVTVYRGCGRGVNMDGISWSLDKEIASKFLTYHRYRVKNPVLITATVKKTKIIALKLDCDEQEVITFSAKRVHIEELLIAEES